METKKRMASTTADTDTNRAKRISKKAKSASTMESSVAAELKNREHSQKDTGR